jgi:hypothetical protein
VSSVLSFGRRPVGVFGMSGVGGASVAGAELEAAGGGAWARPLVFGALGAGVCFLATS